MGFTSYLSGVFFVIGVVLVGNSGAFPASEFSGVSEGSSLIKGTEDNLNLTSVTRPEREIDLRQNLHKHLKPLVGVGASSISNLKKPRPVEKAITPYFVRILKRRPGSSSKESSTEDDLDSTEIPKVLIDRRRNKENPILPVVVIDQNGIPLRNRTVLLEREEKPPRPNELIITEIVESSPVTNPVAEALQSLQDSLSAASSTTVAPTYPEATTTTTSEPVFISSESPFPEPISSTTEAPPPTLSIIEVTPSPITTSAIPEYPKVVTIDSPRDFTTVPISIPPSLVAPEVHETIEPDHTQPDNSFQILDLPHNDESESETSTSHPDSLTSFSTLAVTRVLPDGEKTTVSQEESMQASENLPREFAPTTPVTNSDPTTTVKPPPQLTSPSISTETLQNLMKAALTRILLQQGPTPPAQISTPQQVKLVDNKQSEVVVFSPAPSPAASDLISRPTSPMPSILNALQSLISTIPTTTRPNFYPTDQPHPVKAVESPISTLFSFNPQDNPFSRLFSTTRASTTNYAIVRATRTTTASPTFFINLREAKTTEVPGGGFNQAATTRIPILSSQQQGKTWEEFNGRQNSVNPSPLRAILMMPANFMMGMFKAAQQFGEFLGNTFSNFATAFNPRGRV